MITSKTKTKYFALATWLLIFFFSLYVYFFDNSVIKSGFTNLAGKSLLLAYLLYLLIGCLRGFTLIPITYFIVIGVILFPSWPLYILTMIGVLVSSLSVYYFSEYMNFDEYYEENYPKQINRIKNFLSRNELPVVIFWSFAPFLPTDLICYVCGSLNVNVKKFILGVLIGEGITSGFYIFFGQKILGLII
ncbi:MAG: VTT domain-containing protein [Minisyncoccia bacterium]